MAGSDFQVVIVGGGAAGIAAARRLRDAGVEALLVEARSRLGGRAWTESGSGFPVDLGCGWLHSAERNPWRTIAEAQGCRIDRTPPPWTRPSLPYGFPLAEQAASGKARTKFYLGLASFRDGMPDMPAAAFLEPNGKWNNLINAISTYVSGVELDRVSVVDLTRYADSGIDWRVAEGLGRVIAAHAGNVRVVLNCPVQRIDRSGKRLKVDLAHGTIWAQTVIVTLPSDLIARQAIRFTPALPDKIEAAAGVPLGLADKLFLSLSDPEEFEEDSRLFGCIDARGAGAYHIRPFGRPLIEGYFGGKLAGELEAAGEAEFYDFAISDLVALLGSDFARRVKPLQAHFWGKDPFSRGSYSYALPGKADCRSNLAMPVEDRLFFAGEACSRSDFSTAHGAYFTGVAAAGRALAALRKDRVQ